MKAQAFSLRQALLTVAAGMLLSATVAGEDLPDIGDSSGAFVSPEQEYRVGNAFLRELRAQDAVVTVPELEAYIQSLGSKLGAHSDGHDHAFTFFLVDSAVVNAFAVPGGFIGIHAGLMLETRNESELASVLAHEIAHVTQRHASRTFEAASRLSIPSAVGFLAAIAVGVLNPQAGQAALAAVAAGQQQYALNFTRENEKEADNIGMQLLARSGFRTEAMANFFERLQAANRYNDPKHIPEFLRTHPVTTNRIAEARGRAARGNTTAASESMSFHLARAALRVHSAKDPRAVLRYFEDNLRAGQFEHEAAARYGYALALAAADETGKARLQLERLHQSLPDETFFALALARLNQQDRQYANAVQQYQRLLHQYPNYRPAVLGLAETRLAANQAAAARDLLREYLTQRSMDPAAYKLLSQAQGKLGLKAESHLSNGEYYYANGETELAIQQTKIALQDPQITYYVRERVSARRDQWQKEFDEVEKEKKNASR